MGHLKRYGMYFVFGAMTVTGVYVWENQDKVPRAESYAEVYNAAMERLVVAQLEGDESPDWAPDGESTNLFPSALLTKAFRDRMLSRSVGAFLGIEDPPYHPPSGSVTNGSFDGFPSIGAPPIDDAAVWIFSTNLFYDGSASVYSNFTGVLIGTDTVEGRTVSTYETCLASNYVDGVMTALSVLRPGSMPFPDGVPLTNQPLSQVFETRSGARKDGFSFVFPAEGCAWNTNAGRVAFTFRSQERPYDRVLYKRDLTEPVSVLTNLVYTLREISAPSATGTNMNTGAVVSYIDYTSAGNDPDKYLLDCHNSATNGEAYALLKWEYEFRHEFNASVDYDEFDAVVSEAYDHAYYKKVARPVSFAAGSQFGYPSAYAVTNSYVKRIQVYAVFEPIITHMHYAVPESWLTGAVFEAAFAADIESFGGVSFSHPVGWRDVSAVPTSSTLASLSLPLDFKIRAYTPVLALLKTVENPSSTNDLLWSNVTMPSFTIASAPSANAKCGTIGEPHDPGPGSFDSYSWNYGGTVTITPKKFIMLVGWDWKHLNKNNPYEPPE